MVFAFVRAEELGELDEELAAANGVRNRDLNLREGWVISAYLFLAEDRHGLDCLRWTVRYLCRGCYHHFQAVPRGSTDVVLSTVGTDLAARTPFARAILLGVAEPNSMQQGSIETSMALAPPPHKKVPERFSKACDLFFFQLLEGFRCTSQFFSAAFSAAGKSATGARSVFRMAPRGREEKKGPSLSGHLLKQLGIDGKSRRPNFRAGGSLTDELPLALQGLPRPVPAEAVEEGGTEA